MAVRESNALSECKLIKEKKKKKDFICPRNLARSHPSTSFHHTHPLFPPPSSPSFSTSPNPLPRLNPPHLPPHLPTASPPATSNHPSPKQAPTHQSHRWKTPADASCPPCGATGAPGYNAARALPRPRGHVLVLRRWFLRRGGSCGLHLYVC